MKDWSLIIFTLLVQMGTGAFIFCGISGYVHSHSAEFIKLPRLTFPLISGIIFLATLVSFFHLGNPGNALKALNNLGSSWLSREILLNILFMGIVFAVTASVHIRWMPAGMIKPGILAGSLAGIILIYAMSRLYMLPMVPVWNNFATPAAFCLTALVLGCTFCLVMFTIFSKSPGKWLNPLLAIIVAGLILELVVFGLLLHLLSGCTGAASRSLSILLKDNLPLIIARILLIGLPLVFFSLALIHRSMREWLVSRSILVYIASAVILLSETAGRYLHFIAFVKTGL